MENSATHTQPASEQGAFGFGKTVSAPFADVIAGITEALKGEGFGVLTTIDVQATLKAKIGAEVEAYTILGACNPNLAHRALGVDPEVGLLLPCNVVVRQAATDERGQPQVRVEIVDPQAMLSIVSNPEMHAVADEASARLHRVLEAFTPGETHSA